MENIKTDKKKKRERQKSWDNPVRKEFEDYFEDVLDDIDETREKMETYLTIVDEQINNLISLPTQKSGSRYLIDSVKNATEIVEQLQGLSKEKFNVKKTILEFERKSKAGENLDSNQLIELLQNAQTNIRETKKTEEERLKKKLDEIDQEEINRQIDLRLKELEDEEESD